MRFGVRRLVAFRRDHPVASLSALVGAGTVSLGAVAVVLAMAGSAGSLPRPTASPSSSVEDILSTAPSTGDFADFQALQRKPAAAAPIRRLPRVRLATVSVDGIPPVPLAAYHAAARAEATAQPGCHLPWWLIAGIGFVESGHAHSGGSMQAGWNGVARPPIYGPALDGRHGFKAIPDTDHGELDGDRRWDRAVGPMQFLPSTWLTWGPAGRVDGHADPQDIVAAAHATAGYLCASGSDLSQSHAMALAVYSYNHSFAYVRLVLSVGARYAGLTPDQLGVNLLPKDRPKARHHKGHRRNKHRDSIRGVHRASTPTATPAPSASATPSPSASASPSPSAQPLPNPLPTLTPPVLR